MYLLTPEVTTTSTYASKDFVSWSKTMNVRKIAACTCLLIHIFLFMSNPKLLGGCLWFHFVCWPVWFKLVKTWRKADKNYCFPIKMCWLSTDVISDTSSNFQSKVEYKNSTWKYQNICFVTCFLHTNILRNGVFKTGKTLKMILWLRKHDTSYKIQKLLHTNIKHKALKYANSHNQDNYHNHPLKHGQ